MITRRKLVLALGAGALTPLAGYAQPQPRVFRIGFLSATSAAGWASRVEALRAGLRDLGYVEGRNLVIELRWAEGKIERLPELAAELVRLKVDVIVTQATDATRAAKNATTTIPIVMAGGTDAARAGLVASLARPGGNITGVNTFSPELSAKRLELLKEAVPRTQRVAAPFDEANAQVRLNLQAMELTAKSIKVGLQQIAVHGPDEFKSIFFAMSKQGVDAVALPQDGMLIANAKVIADLAAKQRLPSIGHAAVAENGGLLGYGENTLDLYRRAGVFVDKILKGAKPADLPVEQSTRFELVINMKTAKALGIKFPNSILVQATKVIE